MDKKVYGKSVSLKDISSGYCPGCTHGTASKLIAQTLDKFEIRESTVGVLPIGCSSLGLDYFNFDLTVCAHGRAPAVATGYKRCNPDNVVFTYQGDGDLAAIGLAEIMHCANRGENITSIFINNGIYGMTGGQMAPTTLVGQKATTAPYGRDEGTQGRPIRISEMLATIDGAVFVERVSVDSPANIRKAKKAIKECFKVQLEGKGFGIVEVLSTCPTNWGFTPVEALKWLKDNMIPYYPLGNIKKPEEVE